jgi:hypothetical protein
MMVRVKLVDSPYSLAFGEKGFVKRKGKIVKMSRDKSGRVWWGWRKGTKF